jgi:hypothetical protein
VKRLILLLVVLMMGVTASRAQSTTAAPGQPYAIEYYYKTKWGHADEFLTLFKKNHYPLLKKEVEMGRMIKVWMDQPRITLVKTGAGTTVSPSCSRMRQSRTSRSKKTH